MFSLGPYLRQFRLGSVLQAKVLKSSSFEGHPLQARHKHNWGRGFILLLPQTAALPGSDAGSDVIKFRHPKPSDLVLHVVPDVWGTLLVHGLRFALRRHTRNLVKERDPICAWTNGIAQHQSAGG